MTKYKEWIPLSSTVLKNLFVRFPFHVKDFLRMDITETKFQQCDFRTLSDNTTKRLAIGSSLDMYEHQQRLASTFKIMEQFWFESEETDCMPRAFESWPIARWNRARACVYARVWVGAKREAQRPGWRLSPVMQADSLMTVFALKHSNRWAPQMYTHHMTSATIRVMYGVAFSAKDEQNWWKWNRKIS